jgi:hypothetical protein
MSVTLDKNLRGFQRPLFVYNPMNKQTVIAAEKHYLTAGQRFNVGLTNHLNVAWAHPGHHACAMNAKRDPAAPLQRFCDARYVARAALTADSLLLLPTIENRLHQSLKTELLFSASK